MMDLRETLRSVISGLPEGSSVTLPRSVLASWLDGTGEDPTGAHDGLPVAVADLTVSVLAEALGRAENTVRGWMSNVPGAYKIGGEWRVPRAEWRAYLDSLGSEEKVPMKVRSNRAVALGDWRRARAKGHAV